MIYLRWVVMVTAARLRLAVTVVMCVLAWASGVTGWDWPGQAAMVILTIATGAGYALDIEAGTLRWRLHDAEKEIERRGKRVVAQRAEIMRLRAEKEALRKRVELWVHVAYGAKVRPKLESDVGRGPAHVLDQLDLPVRIDLVKDRFN